ncbi:unnamed protein product [Closterium sp. Naga37s-1]|nr:unnamed protein product [Closterium sp. Naga37s-1]
MDGTFLIRAQRATLLVAAAKDGNNQLVPLAFGLCESENKDTDPWQTGSRPACKGARGRGWVTEPDGCGKTSQNGKDGSVAAKEEWSQGRPADTISAATISAATISASTNSAATISAATTSAATMPAATISAATISAATTSSATIPAAIISAAAISAATISAAP